ncbi:flagellar biosynthesis protein FlhF [Pseudomonas sp.]|uniref:flagellar biosynthesis protein FlhF n=1 Tax=Pseudomonas sp. TaxID=306 RepID=UPI002590051E|nr:flagellar biosynthesis protein FlhF [Pseudomonas sp.]
MGVQRFVGANSREAMHQVRLVLGEDALILSSRSVEEGVEIMAVADDTQPAPLSPRRAAAAYAHMSASGSAGTRKPAGEPAATLDTPGVQPREAVGAGLPVSFPATPMPAGDFAALSQLLRGEMEQMRQLLMQQQPSAPADDSRQALLRDLLGSGFSHCLSQELLDAAPALPGVDGPGRAIWLAERLGARLSVLPDDGPLLEAGGIIALVGPTGVGKTTTTAKLAARFVMRHGADGLALVTTDSFRIGAHEQLRIYAELLGGEVHALGAEDNIEQLLASLSGKRLVIIDTVGMSQRDQRLLAQIKRLANGDSLVRLMLVLNAASHGDTLDEVVDTYRRAALSAGTTLRDCIISKCDEAPRLGPVLDVLIRHDLRLNYLSTGQQVPEDLHLADRPALMNQALTRERPSLYGAGTTALHGKGQQLDTLARNVLGHGRLLATLRASLHRQVDDFALLEQAWHMADLPASQQSQALARLLADTPVPNAANRQILWGAERPVVGATWKMPVLSFTAEGNLQIRPWLAHQLPIGTQPRLEWSSATLGGSRHLWAGSPSRELMQRLLEAGPTWLANAQRGQRVMQGGQSWTLAQLAERSASHGYRALRQRGRWVKLELGYLVVSLPTEPQRPVRAWFGTLRHCDSDQVLGQRYWLADGNGNLAEQADSLSRVQVCESLPALTLRAWNILGERHGPLNADLRLFLATALAACACHLDQVEAEWGQAVRQQLLELSGKRRACSPLVLLESLLHLLTTRAAMARLAHE